MEESNTRTEGRMRLFDRKNIWIALSISLVICLFVTGLSFAAETTAKDAPELKALKYRSIGPAWGGRVSRAAGVPGNPNVYYFGAAASGVWKSIDGGNTWNPIFDDQPISSIGSLAIASSDPNVIYVGAGEANIRGNVAAGNGIYKSVDGGKTWSHVWKQEGQIGTMIVHPTNADIAYAAVLGHAFGPNPERGVYRTKDGGKTWQQVLKKDQDTGASDVAFDPSNPSIVFAGLWQARRYPWGMTSGGPGSGMYVSRDGGDSWKQLTGNGLPEPIWGKVGIAVAPSDGRRVYALIEAEQGGLFRSDDGGDNWTRVSANRLLRQRAWYYTVLTVHPTNPNEVWVPQVPMLKSIDGGATFSAVDGFHHGDHHDFWIDPKDPKRMIAANDGGVDISTDGGKTWSWPALPIAQFYHVGADNRVPFHVAGGIQDIGTAQGPSRTASSSGIRTSDWYGVGGGEAGWAVSDWSDPNIVYAGEYGGIITRYDHRTRQARHIGINPDMPIGHEPKDMRYRFQWTAPITVSPHDAKVVYHGGNILFRTNDGGQTWKPISPDLTRNDPSKLGWSGGPITGDNTGAETYSTIFTISESPLQKDLIWAGSDDGLVHVTTDGGKNWKNVTKGMSGIPEWGTVKIIETSHFDANTAYVVVDAHRLDNTKPYLYKTTNLGDSWQRLDSSLPQDIYLHCVREDPKVKDLLYLGTERGVSYSRDGGKNWQRLKLNLPTVAVHDLAVKDSSLAVGTLGRSIWIFDHLTVLREMSDDIKKADAHLFSVPDAIRWRYTGEFPDKWTGENPPRGAVFYYWLKEEQKNDITVDVLDSSNKVIATLSSVPKPILGLSEDPKAEEEQAKKSALPKKAGVQVAYWDLTYDAPEMVARSQMFGGAASGPMVLPGTYTLRLNVEGKTYTSPVKVIPDPRVKVSEQELKEQLDLAMSLRNDVTEISKQIKKLQSVRKQIRNRTEVLKGNSKAAQLIQDSEAFDKKADVLESKLHNAKAEVGYDVFSLRGGVQLYGRLVQLYSTVADGDGAPTQGMRESYEFVKKDWKAREAELNQLLGSDLKTLNDAARAVDAPTIYVQ
jgi:photosystem II stability/assembly factor-like uncharacterized protein